MQTICQSFQTDELDDEDGARPLAESLLLALADLLFCPDFTVHSHRRGPVRIPFVKVFLLALFPPSWSKVAQ